jgi:hypothetical protein
MMQMDMNIGTASPRPHTCKKAFFSKLGGAEQDTIRKLGPRGYPNRCKKNTRLKTKDGFTTYTFSVSLTSDI